MDKNILNTGLALSMEFGKPWLQSIDERLHKKFPSLNAEQLKEYNRVCEKIKKEGGVLLSTLILLNKGKDSMILFEPWKKEMLKKYPWIHKENSGKLFSQLCYYSYK